MIYSIEPAGDYEWAIPVEDGAFDVLHGLDGRSRLSVWTPIPVTRLTKDAGKKFKPADFPWLTSGVLAMRRSAVDALGDLLRANGEILPLATDDGVELFVYNAQVIDALDAEKSVFKCIALKPRKIMSLSKAAFMTSSITGKDVFCLPKPNNLETYVSEKFVERVKAAGLVGLDFKPQL